MQNVTRGERRVDGKPASKSHDPAPRWPDVSDATRKSMRGNKGKNTAPEMAVRRIVHQMGSRYRIHRTDLAGKPDMVFGPREAVIDVRGCFWHRHPGCRLAYVPKTRPEFWQRKFDGNVARDARNTKALENAGWRVLTVWECEIAHVTMLADKLRNSLEPRPHIATEN